MSCGHPAHTSLRCRATQEIRWHKGAKGSVPEHETFCTFVNLPEYSVRLVKRLEHMRKCPATLRDAAAGIRGIRVAGTTAIVARHRPEAQARNFAVGLRRGQH